MHNTALITGASSGIGRELSHIHAKQGGDLVIIARHENSLQELAKELTTKYEVEVKIIIKDLSDPKAPKEIYDEVKQSKIEIDYLINNAGFGGIGAFYEGSLKTYTDMIQVNITSLTELTHLFLTDFLKRDTGKILNVASVAGLVPGPFHAVYFATKAYVISFTEAIASEVYGKNITVTTLLPGATDTNFAKVANMENTLTFRNAASARKVAQQGYEAMIQGKIQVIAGVQWLDRLQFFLSPFVPKKWLLNMVGKTQKSK